MKASELILVVLFAAAILVLLFAAANDIETRQNCRAGGGTVVKTDRGWSCMKVEK